jgi:ABC-type multidrug transport system fused ATPase/permease subunit
MIIASHRLSSPVRENVIAVPEHGQVKDMAPPAVLFERCPVYAQPWHQRTLYICSWELRKGGTGAFAF